MPSTLQQEQYLDNSKSDHIIPLLKTLHWLSSHVVQNPVCFPWSTRPCIIWPLHISPNSSCFTLPLAHSAPPTPAFCCENTRSSFLLQCLHSHSARHQELNPTHAPTFPCFLLPFRFPFNDTISEWYHSLRSFLCILSQVGSRWFMSPMLISNSLVLSPHFTLEVTQRTLKKWPGSF